MAVSSNTLRRLSALGLSGEQLAGVLDILADQQEAEEARLAAQRERKARNRASSRDSHGTVTGQERDRHSDNLSPKESSPTPPKEITPFQSEAKASSKTPRAALETVLDRQRASDLIEHRQRIRKPLTARAAELLAGQLAQWHDPNEAADAMILNGWQGFKPEYMRNRQARGSPQQRTPSQADVFAMIGKRLENGQTDEDSYGARAPVSYLPAARSG